ncbi:ROK family glucokinase [Falsarthrobacter nasiphocae]|uniref:Glucokinase n=1 Tax=Falsarthrobacter nasiphocae TaxID=189863 RepID=A0AAE4C5Q8_9MICC|nr:ROK family glucokinase [Falsarthrobacter nasiphocae]MDR6891337.1 glucokinase [Falsarthrobacter nasiphocae]
MTQKDSAADAACDAIGIDIGGTKIAAGLVASDGTIRRKLVLPTPGSSPREVENVIATLVDELAADSCVSSVGVGAAGWMDLTNSTVLFSPHLAWRNEPLRASLEARLGRPVIVMNDADAAAVAESQFGAGQGETRLVVITLGTGIGGAIVNDGQLERGRWGVGGEFGHQIFVPRGHVCECGNRGCWEQYASGNALGRLGREMFESGGPRVQALAEAASREGRRVDGALVTRVALEGDPLCQELVEEVGEWLGIGLANLAAALDPGRFVIGGGLSSAGELLLRPAREALAKNLTGRGFRPVAEVVLADLGADAGLVGAAESARRSALAGGESHRP